MNETDREEAIRARASELLEHECHPLRRHNLSEYLLELAEDRESVTLIADLLAQGRYDHAGAALAALSAHYWQTEANHLAEILIEREGVHANEYAH